MNNKDIEWRRIKLKEKRQVLEAGQWNALRELLPNEIIEKVCEECQYYFRVRLLSPLVVIFHMIGAGIHREKSFQSAWHLMGQSGKSGSLSKARQRLPLEVWQRLDNWMIREMDREKQGQYGWCGHRMVGVDGTCFSMSDEPLLRDHFGQGEGVNSSRFPLGRMSLAFDLGTLTLLGHQAGPYRRSEDELLQPILKTLRAGDVLVGDRHFSGANYYAEYQALGLDFITRVHASLKVEKLEILETFEDSDRLVKWKVGGLHRRKNPNLPEWVVVRLIRSQVKINGKKERIEIATSLLDPKRYPAKEVVGQFKRRWKIEGLIEELKLWLGADILRSRSVEGVYKELYARVIGLNLMHWLILKSAKEHGKKPERLSMAATLRLSASYSLKMSTASTWQLPELYDEMLEHISQSSNPFRPNRMEPRLCRRQRRKWDCLKISRSEWRQSYLATP